MVFFEKFTILHNNKNETSNPFHVEVTVTFVSAEKSSGSLHNQCCRGFIAAPTTDYPYHSREPV